MSGFTITLDSILALTVATLLIIWSMEIMASKPLHVDDLLVEYAYDFLAVAEKSGALDNISRGCERVNGSYPCTLQFKQMLAEAPDSICLEAEIYMMNGSLYYHVDNYNDSQIGFKTGCLKGQLTGEGRPASFIKASRVLVHDDLVRPVELELWYKGWKKEE
jgi:hypothetical protein